MQATGKKNLRGSGKFNGVAGLIERHTIPIPLRISGSLPNWVVGTLYMTVPYSFKVRLKKTRGSISGGDLEYMGSDAGNFVETSHLSDGFSMVVRLEILPGGINAVYSQSKLTDDLEAKIAAGSAEWNHSITFGKVYGLDQTNNPITLAAQGAAQIVNDAWSYMSSWLGRSSTTSANVGVRDDQSILKASPSFNGSFPNLITFEQANKGPVIVGISTSMHVTTVDPVTLESTVTPIQVLQDSNLPPLFATNQAYASPAPVMDSGSQILYLPVISLSATSGASCTVLVSHPGIFPRFTTMITLPRAVRASVYPLAALSERYLIIVFPNYYIPNLTGTVQLSLYSTLEEAAVYKPEEPLQFFVISRETRQLVGTFSGESAVVPPGGVVQAFEQKNGNICVDLIAQNGTDWFTCMELRQLLPNAKRSQTLSMNQTIGTIRRYTLPAALLKTAQPLNVVTVENQTVSLRPALENFLHGGSQNGTELFDFSSTATYMHVSNHNVDQPISTGCYTTHIYPDKRMNKPPAFAFGDGGFVYGLSTEAPQSHSVAFNSLIGGKGKASFQSADELPAVPTAAAQWYTHVERIAVGSLDVRHWSSPNCYLGPIFYLSKPDIPFTQAHPLGLHSDNVLLVVVRGARNGLAVLNAHTMQERAFVEFPDDQVIPFSIGGTGLGGCWLYGELPVASNPSPVASPVSVPDTPQSAFPLPTAQLIADAQVVQEGRTSARETSFELELDSGPQQPTIHNPSGPLSVITKEQQNSGALAPQSPAPPSASVFQPRSQNPSPPRAVSPALHLGEMGSTSTLEEAPPQSPPKTSGPRSIVSSQTPSNQAKQALSGGSLTGAKSLNNSITNLHLPIHSNADTSPSPLTVRPALSASVTNLTSPIHRLPSHPKSPGPKPEVCDKSSCGNADESPKSGLSGLDSGVRGLTLEKGASSPVKEAPSSVKSPKSSNGASELVSVTSSAPLSPRSVTVDFEVSDSNTTPEIALVEPSPEIIGGRLVKPDDDEDYCDVEPLASEQDSNDGNPVFAENRARRNSKKKASRKKRK